MSDWLTCIETAYDLSGSDAEWLGRVVARAGSLFRRGSPPLAFSFRCTPTSFEIQTVASNGWPKLENWLWRASEVALPEAVDRVYRSGTPVACLSQQVFRDLPQQRDALLAVTGGMVRDIVGLTAHTGTGLGLSLGVALPLAWPPRAVERRRWPQIACHLAAAWRLRQWAAGLAAVPADAAGQVEAVMLADGRLVHAEAPAAGGDARDALRQAVRRIDAARTRAGRRDPDAALQSWTALIDGRWSLIDRFESDGRRYVVAVRNDPVQAQARGLSQRERQVATYLGLGRSIKDIAYTLGLSPTVVSEAADGAQTKLGLAGRVELAAFFAPAGPCARLVEQHVNGEPLLIGAWSGAGGRDLSVLTEAERAVAGLLLAGSTLADVAQRRGVSVRTVANQAQSLYRKLGVNSRLELAAVLA